MSDTIGDLIDRLARLQRAGRHGGGLNPAQWDTLRYLARANRFSNSPSAASAYLGATKGTVSQTIKSLERKHLIAKGKRPEERRSVAIALTPEGQALIANDPWAQFSDTAETLGGKTRRRLVKGLRKLLEARLAADGRPGFGRCASCRHFREDGREDEGPHLCMHFEEPLSEAESAQICIAHEPGP